MKTDVVCDVRRQYLARGGCYLLGATWVCVALHPAPAAAAKVSKQDFMYQDHPKEGKSCSGCRMFTAAANGKGVCALVEGDVQPNGWCMAYSARQPV